MIISDELRDWLKAKAEELKRVIDRIDNFQNNPLEEFLTADSVKELYHRDLRIYNELIKLINQ